MAVPVESAVTKEKLIVHCSFCNSSGFISVKLKWKVMYCLQSLECMVKQLIPRQQVVCKMY